MKSKKQKTNENIIKTENTLETENGFLKDEAAEPKKKNKKGIFFKIIDVLVPFVAIGVFLYAGLNLYQIQSNYSVAVKEYEELEKFVQIHDIGEGADKITGFPTVEIDFAGLKEVNPDVVGWIYMPVLELSYPVVHGEDNEYYLHHTIEGTTNSSGSIFMDSQSRSDMGDRNTFIYGHNMKNQSMFGSLKRFRQEEGLCDQDPYFYYFMEGRGYKYRIFSYYITKVGSKTYYNIFTDEQYREYTDYIATVNGYASGTEVDTTGMEDIMTLSTCSGSNSNNRTIVHGILQSSYFID